MDRKIEEFLKRCFDKTEWAFLQEQKFFSRFPIESDLDAATVLIRKAHDFLLENNAEGSRSSQFARKPNFDK